MTEISNHERAEVLTQALPYIKKYHHKIVVVKYGGNAMTDENLKMQVMEDIVLLWLTGVKIVLVHGGGPEMTNVMGKMGKEAKFVGGLRVTDEETVDIAKMVLAGKINKELVNIINSKGGNAIGLSGIDASMIQAKMMNKELGFVGDIVNVDITVITDILDKGYIPVISTIAADAAGNIYNINADTAASWIASALKSERLILMTNTVGILTDPKDESTLIAEMTLEEAKAMLKSKSISGGMIPKLSCCIESIKNGVSSVTVMDGRIQHSLLMELLTEEGAGTIIRK